MVDIKNSNICLTTCHAFPSSHNEVFLLGRSKASSDTLILEQIQLLVTFAKSAIPKAPSHTLGERQSPYETHAHQTK